MWITFSQYGAASLFVYYPVILVGLTTLVMFNPLPYMYFKSRMWLIYSLVSTLLFVVAKANHTAVATRGRWAVPRGMAGLLHGRHVLLVNV